MGRQRGLTSDPLVWSVGALGILLILAHLPFLLFEIGALWYRPHYQFAPVFLLGVGLLAVLRLRRVEYVMPGLVGKSAALFALAWLLLAAAVFLNSSWLGTVSFLASLAAVSYWLGGWQLFRQLFPAWALLWLVVPPPFGLDGELILALQSFTSQRSSELLDLLGIPHIMAGHVVEIGGRRLMVEEACSGINSFFSILAFTALYVLLVRRPLVPALILIGSALCWVIAINVARVTGVVWAYASWNLDLTSGWRHQAVGLVMFGVGLALIWSTDQLLLFLTLSRPTARPAKSMGRAGADETPAEGVVCATKRRLSVWPLVAGYGLLLACYLGLYGQALAGRAVDGKRVIFPEQVARETLPAQLADWQQAGFAEEHRNEGSAFGEFSKVWIYKLGTRSAILSLDYPFPGWHDLTRCYLGQGWTIEQEIVHDSAKEKGMEGYVEMGLSRSNGRSSRVLYAQLDQTGRVLQPRQGGAHLSLHRYENILRKWWPGADAGRAEADPPGPIFQLQLVVETFTPLTSAEKAQAETLFLQAMRTLSQP
jgi:exosortase